MPVEKTPVPASHLADQVAEAANHSIRSSRRVANEALDSLTDTVQEMHQEAAPFLDRATEQASALAQRGVDAVRDGSRRLRNQAEHASDSTQRYIQDEPLKAILIAAATGAALMALVSLISRSRDRG